MELPLNLFLVAAALASVIAIVCGVVACRRGAGTKFSFRGAGLCVAPSLVLLALFYSLAIHMRRSLGSWPRSIGEVGFPPDLVTHADLAQLCFSVLLLATLFAWPVGFLTCLLVRTWRRWAVYLAVHALSFAVCCGLMELAPAPFLYWWWD